MANFARCSWGSERGRGWVESIFRFKLATSLLLTKTFNNSFSSIINGILTVRRFSQILQYKPPCREVEVLAVSKCWHIFNDIDSAFSVQKLETKVLEGRVHCSGHHSGLTPVQLPRPQLPAEHSGEYRRHSRPSHFSLSGTSAVRHFAQ